MDDDPLMFALDLVHSGGGSTSKYITNLLQNEDIYTAGWTNLYNSVAMSR